MLSTRTYRSPMIRRNHNLWMKRCKYNTAVRYANKQMGSEFSESNYHSRALLTYITIKIAYFTLQNTSLSVIISTSSPSPPPPNSYWNIARVSNHYLHWLTAIFPSIFFICVETVQSVHWTRETKDIEHMYLLEECVHCAYSSSSSFPLTLPLLSMNSSSALSDRTIFPVVSSRPGIVTIRQFAAQLQTLQPWYTKSAWHLIQQWKITNITWSLYVIRYFFSSTHIKGRTVGCRSNGSNVSYNVSQRWLTAYRQVKRLPSTCREASLRQNRDSTNGADVLMYLSRLLDRSLRSLDCVRWSAAAWSSTTGSYRRFQLF